MKLTWLMLLVPSLVLANAEQCVIQQRTVSQGNVDIQERSNVTREITPLPSGQWRCQVSFKAKIGSVWHTALGEYDWPGDRSQEEACGIAVKTATDNLRQRVGSTKLITDQVVICRDQPDLLTLKDTKPGTVAQLHQFRPHPDFPNAFWHQGTRCRWFLESQYRVKDIYTFQGIICEVQSGGWVVLDKF